MSTIQEQLDEVAVRINHLATVPLYQKPAYLHELLLAEHALLRSMVARIDALTAITAQSVIHGEEES